jgi:hypothetical protein
MKPVYETPPRHGRYLLVSLVLSAAVMVSAFCVMKAQAAARQARAAEARAAKATKEAKAVAQKAKQAQPMPLEGPSDLSKPTVPSRNNLALINDVGVASRPAVKWEYKITDVNEAEINKLGADGWEAAFSVAGNTHILFKRPLRDAATVGVELKFTEPTPEKP